MTLPPEKIGDKGQRYVLQSYKEYSRALGRLTDMGIDIHEENGQT